MDIDTEHKTIPQSNWIRRLSTFSIGETGSQRSHSANLSLYNEFNSNASATSDIPIPPRSVSQSTTRNKLVKRPSSSRVSISDSISLKRPATSHDRDANLNTIRRRPSTPLSSMLSHSPRLNTPPSHWKTYFTPKIVVDNGNSTSRRSSTIFIKPMQRFMFDSSTPPILISAREDIDPVEVGVESPHVYSHNSQPKPVKRFFSAPLPQRPSTASSTASTQSPPHYMNFDFTAENKRSFSPISIPLDLPKWKRPNKKKSGEPKYRRKGIRTVSGTEVLQIPSDDDDVSALGLQERPTKRRIGEKVALVEVQANRSANPGQTRTFRAFSPTSENEFSENYPSVKGKAHSDADNTAVRRYATQARKSTTKEVLMATGSDSDVTHNEDEGFDSTNDTLFDSIKTRATSHSSTVFKSPRIDTFFDDTRYESGGESCNGFESSFPPLNKTKDTFEGLRHSVIEEEDTINTPIGSAEPSPRKSFSISSSPPPLPMILRRRASPILPQQDTFDTEMDIDNEDAWDFGDETIQKFPDLPIIEHPISQHVNDNFSGNQRLLRAPSPSIHGRHESRGNIFDWSEQPSDTLLIGTSPRRPRTVHGKKDAASRGSRTTGRRVPSGIHVRSQSVPLVAQEVDGKRSQVTSNKFGTWGVGSKGVTEDWNEDFDFDDNDPDRSVEASACSTRQNSITMRVPEAIQEQQDKVLANIGLLRDWGLIIEELKELRGRSQSLDIINLLQDPTWNEVDAMIDLADHESNDHTIDPRSSPQSSPTLDLAAFDEPFLHVSAKNSPRSGLKVHAEDIFQSPVTGMSFKTPEKPLTTFTRRARKDSEAVARSVIETLQQNRKRLDITSQETPKAEPTKKVPFDTATLRRLVPYVQDLRDTVKQRIREAEALYSSPKHGQQKAQTSSSPSATHVTKRLNPLKSETVQPNSMSSNASADDEISRQIELMTID